MFCKKCGSKMGDEAGFCPQCGWKVGESLEHTNENLNYVQEEKRPEYMNSVEDETKGIDGVFIRKPNSIGNSMSRNISEKKNGKTKPPVVVILASVFGTFIVLFFILLVVGSKGRGDNSEIDTSVQIQEDNSAYDPNEDEIVSSGSVNINDKEEVNAESINQLLSLLDETFKKEDELRHRNEGKPIEYGLETTIEFIEHIKDQRQRIYDIEGLPKNIEVAGIDFYNLYEDAWNVTYLDNQFFLGYDELTAEINPQNFFEDPQKNYDNFIQRYNTISCPDNWNDHWEVIRKTLDYYAESVNRYIEAVERNDQLSYSSAYNLIERYFTCIKNETKSFEKLLNDELSFAYAQLKTAQSIYDEIEKVSELTDEDVNQYVLGYGIENVIPTPIIYDTISTIYPSLYNSYTSFLTVELGCLHGERDIILECEIPGLSQPLKQSYHIGSGLHVLSIKPPALLEKLNLDNAKDTQIKVSIYDKKDNSLIDAHSENVHIASRNDFVWFSDDYGNITKDNILCFLTPTSEAIAGLKRSAIDNLEQMTGGEMNALVGYQGPYYLKDSDGDGKADNTGVAMYLTTFMQTASLMRAMSDIGVKYTNDVFSINNEGQHILFPDEVLERQTGLCIETSLVIASALQSMQMHTFLVFPPGHAQVAVETWDGSGEYLLIETTSIPNEDSDFLDEANHFLNGSDSDNSPISYLTAEQWKQYLTNNTDDMSDDCYVIDCSDGAFLGLTPFAY